MSVRAAIDAATSLLPGEPVQSGPDPRWQAIIRVAEFLESDPAEVWNFAAVWGCSADADLRAAVATCLLEHLLEHRFAEIFPQAAELARSDHQFAKTLRLCWRFGDAAGSQNAEAFNGLLKELRHDA